MPLARRFSVSEVQSDVRVRLGRPPSLAVRPCRYQVSVTAGTILHNSKIPLTTWFWAAYLMTTDKRGLSALLLQQQLGLRRYETAWMMLHKLRRAMVTQRGTRFAARLRWTRRGSGELRQDCGAVASSEGATPHWFW